MKKNLNNNIIAIVIITLIVSDLWMFGMKYIQVIDPDDIYGKDKSINFIIEESKNEDRFRVLGMNHTLRQNRVGRYGIEIIHEMNPASFLYYAEYLAAIGNQTFDASNANIVVSDIKNPKLLDLLNVKYLLTTGELTSQRYSLQLKTNVSSIDINRHLEFNQTVYVYKNDHVLPRAFIVHNYKILSDKNDIIEELKSNLFDPRSYVILEEDPNKILIENDTVEEVKIIYYSPNKVVLNANVSKPGFLVLSEVWCHAWKAYVDSTETKVYKTDYILRSIYLSEGTHRIEFVYNSKYYQVGLLITVLTTLILLVFIIYNYFIRIKLRTKVHK